MTKKVKAQDKTKVLTADKRRFRAIEIYCWIQKKAGLTYEEIAQKIGMSPRQTFRLVEKIDDALTGMLNIEDYRNIAFFGNILQALDNLGYFLSRRKERPTMEFLKGVGILREFIHNENLERPPSADELRGDIRKLSKLIGASGQINTAPGSRIS